MATKKMKTSYPGVRFYEHRTRKQRNGQLDRYFSIRWRHGGQLKEEGLGWSTEGWNAEKAYNVLAEIKENIRLAKGPQSLSEKRADAASQKVLQEKEAAANSIVNILFDDFFYNYYISEAKRTKGSWKTDIQRYEKYIKNILGFLPLRNITKDDIQKFIDYLVSIGLSASTIRQYRVIISYSYSIASQTKVNGIYIFEGIPPTKGVKVPPVKNSRERFLTAYEAKILINAAKQLPCPDLHDCIVLSLNTGLRLGELLRLEWTEVDLTHGILTVMDEAFRKPGGKIPLNNAAITIFKSRLKKFSGIKYHGAVFPPIGDGQARGRCNISIRFRELVDSLGLNNGINPKDRSRRIVFHSLRHTFASWLAINGTDIYRIQKLMRHRDIAMTMRYAHLIPDATRDAVCNLKPPKSI